MTTAVIDASVAAKWFLQEPLTANAVRVLTTVDDRRAPRLIVSELGNTFWKNVAAGRMTQAHAETALAAATARFLRLEPDEADAEDALRLSLALNHPFYDCLYLALAKRLQAVLITADARLLALAASPAAGGALVVDLASF